MRIDEKLVFGDLKSLYKRQANGTIAEIGEQFERLQEIEEQVFVTFVSFILSRAGYDDTTILDAFKDASYNDDEDVNSMRTTIAGDKDSVWFDHATNFMGVKEEEHALAAIGGVDQIFFGFPKFLTWSHCYKHCQTNVKLKVIFNRSSSLGVPSDMSDYANWKSLRGIDLSCKNYIVLYPGEKLSQEQEQLKSTLLQGNISLVTVGELVDEFIARDAKVKVLKNWSWVRESVFEEFKSYVPLVVQAFDPRVMSTEELIDKPESDRLEFKASISYDLKICNFKKDREHDVAKALAAFLNTNGGVLILGVSDDKHELLGLEMDLAKPVEKGSEDALGLRLRNIINNYLGVTNHQFIHPRFETIGNKLIGRIDVDPAKSEVFCKDQDGKRTFYFRTNNSSSPLEAEDQVKYIKDHFWIKRKTNKETT
jgi:hypothetical protein